MDQEKYNCLIEKVHFQELFLKDIHISRYPTLVDEELIAKVNFSSSLAHFSEDDLIASVKFTVTAHKLDDEKIFLMDFEYVVIYSIDDVGSELTRPTVKEAELFSEENVPINIWPFAREFISDMTGRIGVPRLMIDMYRQVPDHKRTVDENDKD